jgi:hypothetical protein
MGKPQSSKLTMALHILQLLFSVSVRPISYITPPVFLIIPRAGHSGMCTCHSQNVIKKIKRGR